MAEKKNKSEIYDVLYAEYGLTTTPDAIARSILHISPTTCRRLCIAGVIPSVKVGKFWVIPTAKLADFLECGEAHA